MIIYGKQVVMYMMSHYPENIIEFYFSKEIPQDLFRKISKLSKPILRLDNKKAQAMAQNRNHQGFFAKIIPPSPTDFKIIKKYSKILVLCSISDVGNIGAIFRSAYCLGIEGIIISGIENISIEGILRSSVGAMLDMPFCIYKNTLDMINELKNEEIFCYGADLNGEDIKNIESKNKWALFLGNENEGLNRKIVSKLDKIITIKMKNHFNSLNVSVAAGILINRMC